MFDIKLYLEVNTTKIIQSLYIRHDKIILRDIKEDLNKQRH